MIKVIVCSADQKPFEKARFELVSGEGTVVCRAETDVDGVLIFDVDPLSVGEVAIRLDCEATERISKTP